MVALHPAAQRELSGLAEPVRERFIAAFRSLEIDPFRPRPGTDIRKLDAAADAPLYRLRVGPRRACSAVFVAPKRVLVLLIADREEGYARLLRAALDRLRSFRP